MQTKAHGVYIVYLANYKYNSTAASPTPKGATWVCATGDKVELDIHSLPGSILKVRFSF